MNVSRPVSLSDFEGRPRWPRDRRGTALVFAWQAAQRRCLRCGILNAARRADEQPQCFVHSRLLHLPPPASWSDPPRRHSRLLDRDRPPPTVVAATQQIEETAGARSRQSSRLLALARLEPAHEVDRRTIRVGRHGGGHDLVRDRVVVCERDRLPWCDRHRTGRQSRGRDGNRRAFRTWRRHIWSRR